MAVMLCVALSMGKAWTADNQGAGGGADASAPVVVPTSDEKPTLLPAEESPPKPSVAPAQAVAPPIAPLAAQPASRGAGAEKPAAGRGRSRRPPYLLPDRTITVFDPSESGSLASIRQAAARIAMAERRDVPLPLASAPGMLTFEYELEGKTEREILNKADVMALQAAAGRVYFDDAMLIGRDLLKNYLAVNGGPFISNHMVEGRKLIADGTAMRLKVSVDLAAFYRDLNEKRFVVQPSQRPWASLHLAETMDDLPNAAGDGRQLMEKVLQDYQIGARSREMPPASLTLDLASSPTLLEQVRQQAQRHAVDVLITGSLAIRSGARRDILYDAHDFMKGELTLKMYRADTGEMLQEVTDEYSAQGDTRKQATEKMLSVLMERATRKLAETLHQDWGRVMLDQADCRLMFTGVEPTLQSNVLNDLKRLSPDLQIFQKAAYGGVLVVNLVMPEQAKAQLEYFLRSSTEPRFDVKKVDARHYELKVM
jgi:hypothetical protein